MSNQLQEAVHLVKDQAKLFRAVIALSDAVEHLGGLEKAEKHFHNVKAELARAEADLSASKASLKASQEQSEAAARQARELTSGIALKAAQDAKPLIEAQDARVAEAVAKAKAANADFVKVGDAIEKRRKELAEIEARIASVKSAAAKALGV